jgi:TatD DNase family protein
MPSSFDAHSHLFGISPGHQDHPRVVCGTCELDWENTLKLAVSDRQVIPMLGLHPWRVGEASIEWTAHLEDLVHSHPVGVGECGLDFSKRETDRVAQISAFSWHLRLAHNLHRPLAIHCVRAWSPLLDLLREEGAPPAGALVHGFSGSLETAEILQNMGLFLSFSGDILNPLRMKLREVLAGVDPSSLLVETDGIADLKLVIACAAEIRGMNPDDLRDLIWENGQRCFKELLP